MAFAIPAFFGGIGLIAMIYTPASSMALGIAFLSVASLGIITTMPLVLGYSDPLPQGRGRGWTETK